MNGWRPSRRWGWAMSVLLAWLAMGCATLERDIVASPLDGGAVTLRKGNALVVSLAPDPAAGYGWVLKSADPNMRKIGGPDYTQDPKPPGLAGMAATTTYRFRATAAGHFDHRVRVGGAAGPASGAGQGGAIPGDGAAARVFRVVVVDAARGLKLL